jgi:non-ribosomal peptide synthetase component F
MIGMFVATLPYRIQLDPHWSFDELVKHVREKCLSILDHSHYPLQHILADFRLNQSNVPFLETMFDYITVSSDVDHLALNNIRLEQISMKQSYQITKFDFMITFVYSPSSNDDLLSFHVACSRDLFDEITVAQTAQRFQYLFEQLFRAKSTTIPMDECVTSIHKLSVILPEEVKELQTVIFQRLENIVNEGM